MYRYICIYMEYVCLIHTHSYMYIMNVVSKIYQRRTLGCNNSSWSSPLCIFGRRRRRILQQADVPKRS